MGYVFVNSGVVPPLTSRGNSQTALISTSSESRKSSDPAMHTCIIFFSRVLRGSGKWGKYSSHA